jgi:hypothetical protein
MIELVKELVKHKFGSEKPELLADDFQFRFPVVELGKKEFIQAFGSFKLDQAFPDMVTEYYGFRLDPHIPGRIWYDTIGGGTHTGPMGGPFKRVKPTGKTISLPPQVSATYSWRTASLLLLCFCLFTRRIHPHRGYPVSQLCAP